MFMAVVMILAAPMIVAMVVVFGKTGAVEMCMAAALDRYNDIEAVRLWTCLVKLESSSEAKRSI